MSTTAWVYTMTRLGEVGAWSRYVFPFAITDFTQQGDHLYIRAGDDVLQVDASVTSDYYGRAVEDGDAVDFDGIVQWPWLDFGQPGVTKKLLGFDVVGTGVPTVQVGYDQTTPATFTTGFDVLADTVPGGIIPLSVMAPSMSLKITYAGGQAWQLQAVSLYLQDQRRTA
jgi:hypothetical protein